MPNVPGKLEWMYDGNVFVSDDKNIRFTKDIHKTENCGKAWLSTNRKDTAHKKEE